MFNKKLASIFFLFFLFLLFFQVKTTFAADSKECTDNGGICFKKASCTSGKGVSLGDFGCIVANSDNPDFTCCGYSCEKKEDGAICAENGETGYCYNKKCKTNEGKQGDLCGAGETDTHKSSCGQSTDCEKDTTGRDCESELNCCKRISVNIGSPTETVSCEKSHTEGLASGFLFFKGSIVPCGRKCNDDNTNWDETGSCTFCHFFIVFKQLYDLMLSLLVVAALGIITIGGLIYILSGGNPGMKTTAKNMISKVLVGFGLFLLSWLLVFTILKFISVKTSFLGNGDKWYEFSCDLDSPFDGKIQEK